jgi:hypothetical protein
MSEKERTVAFGVVDESRIGEHIQRQQDHDGGKMSLGSIVDAVPKFTPVVHLASFRAEWVLQSGRDLVIHFFPPVGLAGPGNPVHRDYWLTRFPTFLDSTARSYFQAERPRLQAKYTVEVDSWWFKANGYEHIIDLAGFVGKFLEALDASLRGVGQA